jgi:hypothetical protein
MENSLVVKVVEYMGGYFVWYKTNSSKFAQLLTSTGDKWCGTPSIDKLKVIKEINCKKYNRSWYFMTKIGCFSATTGKKVVDPNILGLFK